MLVSGSVRDLDSPRRRTTGRQVRRALLAALAVPTLLMAAAPAAGAATATVRAG